MKNTTVNVCVDIKYSKIYYIIYNFSMDENNIDINKFFIYQSIYLHCEMYSNDLKM